MGAVINDSKGRPLIMLDDDGNISISRYNDMVEKEIELVKRVFCRMSGANPANVEGFLRFDVNEYCS